MTKKVEKFSLKDELFNKEKVVYLSELLVEVEKKFDKESFVKEVMEKFPELELKERIYHIRTMLKKHLEYISGESYEKNLEILLKSLPQELDPQKKDDDFGDFIFAPYGDFVSEYGCEKKYLENSLNALEEITKRFSTEDAMRSFINNFEKETFEKMIKWSKSDNYHVRRLASEGSRPKLPWAKKINIDYKKPIKILDNLFYDPTRYVTRSVANHMNDISKMDPEIVLETLGRWKESSKQEKKEMNFIIQHSLRTLVKKGHRETLEFLGFSSEPRIVLKNFTLKNNVMKLSKMKNSLEKYDLVKKEGQALEFSFEVLAEKDENIIIDYKIFFQNKNGKQGEKVFKLTKDFLKKGERKEFSKKHPLRIMSTKKLYPGEHSLEVHINGKVFWKEEFRIIE